MYIFARRHQLRHCRPLMYSTQQIDHPKNSALVLPFKSFLTGPAEYMGMVEKLSPFNFSNPISIPANFDNFTTQCCVGCRP